MTATLVKKALEIVPNPNVLVNMVSRRVRQLNAGGGGVARPMIADVANLRAGDIALSEIGEGKLGFEMPEIIALTRPTGKGRNRSAGQKHRQGREVSGTLPSDFPARYGGGTYS